MSALERAVRDNSFSLREEQALALLRQDGWSLGELAMTFQASERAVCRALDEQGVTVDDE